MPKPELPENPSELDGIPVGYYPDRVCWIPEFGGGYFLHDPERHDRLEGHL